MKLLVAGREGQVARSLAAAASGSDLQVVARGRPDLDLTAPETIARTLNAERPDIIVNAAAYTAVDTAETDEEAACRLNGAGAEALAAAGAAADIPIIHLSTDYVFDGAKPAPYLETDPVAPIGAYGRSKCDGERRVAAANARHIILRTSWVVSPYGSNFVKTMLRLAATRSEIGVVDDQTGSPTYAPHLAAAILAIARQATTSADDTQWGIYHAAGSGETTWCGLAREIFARSSLLGGAFAEVRAIATADYPTPARRPVNSRLDCSKLERNFGIRLPDWRIGIGECVEALLAGPH